jgi:hypothetical protein
LILLTTLNLAYNNLSGEFPDLSGLVHLTVLNLDSNDLLTGNNTSLDVAIAKETTVEDNDMNKNGPPIAAIITISVALATIVVILVSALLAYKYHFRAKIMDRKRRERDDESSEIKSSGVNDQSAWGEVGGSQVEMPSRMMPLFGSKKLRITKQISKGGFGYVYEGVYEGRAVAVKRIIVPLKKKDKLRLARMFGMSLYSLTAVDEAATMNLMKHDRIVEFIGN